MKKMWSKMLKKRGSGDQGDTQHIPAVEERSRSDDFVTKPPESKGRPPSPRLEQLRREGGVVTDNQKDNTRLPTIASTSETTQRPLIENSPEMINVDMNSYGVTRGDSANPILKTHGVGPCVSVVLYDSGKQLAGLAHITSRMEDGIKGVPVWMSVNNDIVKVLGTMQRHGLTYEDRKTLQVSLIGGQESPMTHDLFSIAEERLKQLRMQNIVFREKGSIQEQAKNVAFDSRTGQLYDLPDLKPSESTITNPYLFLRSEDGQALNITSDMRSLR
jgi:chemotaxis receptor (MCP) glutamine deamidase CheD